MCEKCHSELEEKLLDAREDCPLEGETEYTLSPLLMTTENLVDVEYCEELFQAGVEDMSFTAGQLTALINVGLSPEDALQYIMNQEIIESNYIMGKLNQETSVAVAKEHGVAVEKNSI